MTILVTGGCGFVGHHFVEYVLKETDWNIVVLDALTYAGDLNRLTDIEEFDKKRVKFIWHDLRSPLKGIGDFDYVVHFAAESHVDRSLEDAVPFAHTNVVGTTNLLEFLKDREIERYIGFNTDEVFGAAPEGVYYKESDKFTPSNPYAAAKAGQWAMEYAFAHAFKMPITMVHSMNIVGQRQNPEKFLPLCIKKLVKGEKITLHGRGPNDLSSRCWIHARNVADAVLFLLKEGKTGQTYNIVGEEKNVREIADWVSEVINERKLKDEEIIYIDYHTARPGHDKRYALDGSKLEKMGWSPPVNLEESIKKTVDWTLNNKKWI